jgi:ribosomal-protein-alanine N-acetyltransferase
MPLHLRPYDPADFETLYAIDRACYAQGIAYSRRALREFLETPGTDTLVAHVAPGGKESIAGFLIAEAREAEAHIITIDVVEEHRRSGIGTALLRGAEQRLAARGVREVFLETATSNEAGVAFWKRHGYRSCGVLRRYYLGRLDAYLMRKDLDSDRPTTP